MCMVDSQIPILHNLWVFATKSRTNVASRDHHVQNTCMLFIAYIVSLQDTSVGLKGISYSKGGQFIICRDVKYILASIFYSQQQLRLDKAWKTFSYCYSTSCKLQMAFLPIFIDFAYRVKAICVKIAFLSDYRYLRHKRYLFFLFSPSRWIVGFHMSAKTFIWKPRTFPLGLSVEPIEQSCSKLFFFQLFS